MLLGRAESKEEVERRVVVDKGRRNRRLQLNSFLVSVVIAAKSIIPIVKRDVALFVRVKLTEQFFNKLAG